MTRGEKQKGAKVGGKFWLQYSVLLVVVVVGTTTLRFAKTAGQL
jgi:hypothetical protein